MTTPQFKHGALAWLAAAGACITAIGAQATESVAGRDGLMVFPYARVTTLAASAAGAGAAAPAPAQEGVKAYKDPASGQLVQPTGDQVAELDAAAAKAAADAVRLASPAQRTRMAAKPATTFYPPQGGVGMVLDDAHVSYAIARKDAHGAIVEECVPDAATAERTLQGGASPGSAAKGEVK